MMQLSATFIPIARLAPVIDQKYLLLCRHYIAKGKAEQYLTSKDLYIVEGQLRQHTDAFAPNGSRLIWQPYLPTAKHHTTEELDVVAAAPFSQQTKIGY